MTEVRISILGPHFDTSREEFTIFFVFYSVRVNRLRETRPSSSRVILIEGRIEWCAVNDIYIDTCSLVIIVFVIKWSFCCFFLGDLILEWCEPISEIFICELIEFFSPGIFDIVLTSTSLLVEGVSER